jgi:hypothetical protein
MKLNKVFMLAVVGILCLGLASAGVGISWNQESVLIPENEQTCLTYKVYNPWDEDSNAQIRLSDELNDVIVSGKSDTKWIPRQTSSEEAIPVTFCFRTPSVYEKDCWFGNMFCEQKCTEPMKVYGGDVEVFESPKDASLTGTGGSASIMAVSAPLNVKVQCNEHSRSYAPLYILVALVAVILLIKNLFSKGTKGKSKKKRK